MVAPARRPRGSAAPPRLSMRPRHIRADSSSSTRKPIETTSSTPSPIGALVGDDLLVARLEPSRRPSTPSMRGTEKPQMSASSTPTVKPWAARAAARFTVTDDLPTPPLPEATAMTRVVAGTAVSGAAPSTFQRALAMAVGLLVGVISVQSSFTPVTPGERLDPGQDVLLDLGPQRATRGGEGDGDRDDAVVGHGDRLGHAEVDDVAAQLGVDDAAEQADDVVAAGQGRRRPRR